MYHQPTCYQPDIAVTSALRDRRFLITGGTGSFGRTMAQRLLALGAAEVRVLSRDEAKQDAMRQELRDDRVRYYLGDVRDYDSVLRASRDVEHVFHAAALKQVPSCEFFPIEAVRTNVLGSGNVMDAGERNGVLSIVVLSTDKAVRPVNAMGMSKALMEKLAWAHARNNTGSPTTVCGVRYGNVMYSRGSVIPLFIDQLRASRPLTVTDPAMTRFMMSLEDSVNLVEYAFTHGRRGDLFVQKAPACTVGDLAQAVCNLFRVPLELKVIGTRHGEKQSETLATAEELARADDYETYFRIPVDSRDLNYSLYTERGDEMVGRSEDYDSASAPRLTVAQVESLLRTLPEVRSELARLLVGVG